jgi:chloramphenicol 3-O phosphotransferase
VTAKTQAGEIIILNGTSCAGKTTVAQTMQKISAKPYLSTGHDDFLPMFPLKYVGLDKSIQPEIHVWPLPGSPMTREGYEVIVSEPGNPPKFNLFCGPVAWRSLQGMHAAFAALARSGNNVIIGDVVSEPLLIDYFEALKGLNVYLVYLQCPIEELENRERAHKNRTVGGARMQLHAVTVPGEFDLIVDSSKNDPKACANQILDFVSKNQPKVFSQLAARYSAKKVETFPVKIW